MKEELDRQIRELLDYMGRAWEGYKGALAEGKPEVASSYLSGFCTHVESLERALDIKRKAKELGLNPGSQPAKEELMKKVSEIARGISDREAEGELKAHLGALVGEEISIAVDRWKDFSAAAELTAHPETYIGRKLSDEEYRTLGDFSRRAMEDATETSKGLPLIKGGAEIIQREGWEKHYSGPDPAWLLLPAAVAAGMLAGWLRGRRGY